MLRLEHVLDSFAAAGCDGGAVYVSMPVSSGLREVQLAVKNQCDLGLVRSTFTAQWRSEVLLPNEFDGQIAVQRVRNNFPERVVVDPSRLTVEGWEQSDYMSLWLGFLERFAVVVAAAPNWQYSRGARTEVTLAIFLGYEVITSDGEQLSEDNVRKYCEDAFIELLQMGLTRESVAEYLSMVRVEQPVGEAKGPAAQVFDWLTRERVYQIDKFGISQDDTHTREGVGPDTWWDQQLTNYLWRFRVLGLDTMVGRQALAKYVATGAGLLESAIRVYGELPTPGVPSGEIQASTKALG